MPATATTDACDRPRAITTMGRRGSRANGPSWDLAQRGRVAYAFLRISRRTKSISGVSINRFHVVHAYRSNTKLPMVATCVRALHCPALPIPTHVRASVCVRACVRDASAYAAGTRRGRPCRSGFRRCPRSAPCCCGRSPPPGARLVPDLQWGLGGPAPYTSPWGLNGLTPQASPPGPGLTHTAAERVHSL